MKAGASYLHKKLKIFFAYLIFSNNFSGPPGALFSNTVVYKEFVLLMKDDY